jgi:hypothetical protein
VELREETDAEVDEAVEAAVVAAVAGGATGARGASDVGEALANRFSSELSLPLITPDTAETGCEIAPESGGCWESGVAGTVSLSAIFLSLSSVSSVIGSSGVETRSVSSEKTLVLLSKRRVPSATPEEDERPAATVLSVTLSCDSELIGEAAGVGGGVV